MSTHVTVIFLPSPVQQPACNDYNHAQMNAYTYHHMPPHPPYN